ncbi:MAG: class III extradiol dioxygenase subunit B-like domain-containing protein, partial [Candidatus Eremiobacterota bacterium]
MPLILGGLVPHPPLLVPEVGGARLQDVDRTRLALEGLCREVTEAAPERLVMVTPHGPYQRGRMSCLAAPHLNGNLARFGCPEVSLRWPVDQALCRRLVEAAERRGVPVDLLEGVELDHALMVPLVYLARAGFQAPMVALSISGLPRSSHLALGQAVAETLAPHPAVLLASGDLSHRLLEDGPYGFDPRGPVFDREVVRHLDPLDRDALASLPEDLVEGAGVCGMKPLMVLLGALPPQSRGKVLSYEGPFGVGYAVARLTPPHDAEAEPLRLARAAVETWVREQREL